MDMTKHSLLAAQSLAEDPRVAEGKRLLLEAVHDHQKNLKAIRPSDPALKQHYTQMLNDFANYRGAKLWFPYLGSGLGNGPLVELADGSVKFDFISGIGPHYWGHSHPDIIEANIDAALSDLIMQGHLQQNVDALAMTELLVKHSGMDHCFLSSTGAMANENALKLIFQKKFPAQRLFAFDRCFMGRTLALSQITDRPLYREGLPTTMPIDYIPFFDPTHPEESTQRALDILKRYLARYPNGYAAMCFELIQGDGGFHTGSKEFFTTIMTLLKEHRVAIHVDEVQSFGRTEKLFAFQYFGLESFVDVVALGKLAQVCATLFTEEFKPKPGLLSQTFTASTSAIKSGQVIINGLLQGGFFGPDGKIALLSQHFISKLQALAKRYPDRAEGPFGLGTMIAFTPFKGDAQKVNRFVLDLFDAGVLSFITGSNPTRARFLIPAGIVSLEDIDKVMTIVEEVIQR